MKPLEIALIRLAKTMFRFKDYVLKAPDQKSKTTVARTIVLSLLLLFVNLPSFASYILIPMDEDTQDDHLKAYGITYWLLEKRQKVKWLLNYRGGSFLISDVEDTQKECKIRGVSFEILSDAKATAILQEINSPSQNMEAVILEKAPKNCRIFSKKQATLG